MPSIDKDFSDLGFGESPSKEGQTGPRTLPHIVAIGLHVVAHVVPAEEPERAHEAHAEPGAIVDEILLARILGVLRKVSQMRADFDGRAIDDRCIA